MSDLISRRDAIDALDTVGYDFSESGLSEAELIEVCEAVGYVRQDMISRIKKLPSAQPDLSGYSDRLWKAAYERGKREGCKTGKWIDLWDRYRCSVCNMEHTYEENFCPNCGADMRGGD